MTQASPTDIALWRELVEQEHAYSRAFRGFLTGSKNRVAVVREALIGHGRPTALGIVPYLTVEERKELFAALVFLASWAHGGIQAARDLILSLPREWVLENVEQEAEPLLREGTYDEYRRFLELYELVGASDLVRRLARRAAAHPDPDIREAGEDFLAKEAPAAGATAP